MWARTAANPALLEGARPELKRAKVTRNQLALKSTQDARFARLAGEPQITEANIAPLRGHQGVQRRFPRCCRRFPDGRARKPVLDDERQEEMILRRVTFLSWRAATI